MSDLPAGITSLFGVPGSLKSSIALQWPKPIDYYDFDLGVTRAWEYLKLLKSGELRIFKPLMPSKSLTSRYSLLDGFAAEWKRLQEQLVNSCDGDCKTIVIDTGTVLRQLVVDAYLEELQKSQIAGGKKPADVTKQLPQIMYGEPNRRIQGLYDIIKASGKHLILVHHEAAEYAPEIVAGKPVRDESGNPKSYATGRMIIDGWKATEGASSWVLRTEKSMVAGEDGRKVVVPKVTIEKSALGIDLVGAEIVWFTYDKLVQMLVMLGRIE